MQHLLSTPFDVEVPHHPGYYLKWKGMIAPFVIKPFFTRGGTHPTFGKPLALSGFAHILTFDFDLEMVKH